MWWTIALVTTGIGGLWWAATSWKGWILYTLNEVLWFAYAVSIGATPLMLMAVIWFGLGVRNIRKARQVQPRLACGCSRVTERCDHEHRTG